MPWPRSVTRWPAGRQHLRVLRRASRRCLARRRMMEDRHVAVLLEEIRGQFRGFGDKLQDTNDKITVMAGNIAVMDGKIAVMDGKIDQLSVDMVDVKTRLTRVE